jgi:hypothetical protein
MVEHPLSDSAAIATSPKDLASIAALAVVMRHHAGLIPSIDMWIPSLFRQYCVFVRACWRKAAHNYEFSR